MELDPEARHILDLTREARTPTVEDKLRIERLLSRSLRVAALSSAAGASSAAAAKPVLAALAIKWTAIVAVPALIAAGASTLYRREPAPATPPELKAVVQPPAAESARARAEAAQVRETPPEAPLPNEQAEVSRPPARAADTRERRRPPTASHEPDSLNQELDLLHEAQAAWRRGDGVLALSLLAQHRQRYPKSVLGPEREALRILGLCATGRTAEAKEAARRSFPKGQRSPLRASVEQSCIKD